MSRQLATNVTTIYDIFCPVPFLPSPFGFRRINLKKILGTLAGCPWDTWRDKQGSRPVSR